MNFTELVNQVTHPEDVTDTFSPDDVKANQASGVLASIPALFWLPLVIAKDSPYGKFCANQGLIQVVLIFAVTFACAIVSTVLSYVPILGGVLSWVVGMIRYAIVCASFLLLLVSACQGRARKLPLVGNLFEAFK